MIKLHIKQAVQQPECLFPVHLVKGKLVRTFRMDTIRGPGQSLPTAQVAAEARRSISSQKPSAGGWHLVDNLVDALEHFLLLKRSVLEETAGCIYHDTMNRLEFG